MKITVAALIFPVDSVNNFRHNLLNPYLESTRQLSEILISNGLQNEAIKVAQEALKYDRTNEDLIRLIYKVQTQNGDLVMARKSIRQYEEALFRDGYPSSEIEEILEFFWAGVL